MSKAVAEVKRPFQKIYDKVTNPFQQFGDAFSAAEGERVGNSVRLGENLQEANDLSGSAAANTLTDAGELNLEDGARLFQGDSARNEQLISLVNAFNSRQQEVRQRITEPGNSQTRLSMVQ